MLCSYRLSFSLFATSGRLPFERGVSKRKRGDLLFSLRLASRFLSLRPSSRFLSLRFLSRAARVPSCARPALIRRPLRNADVVDCV